MSEPVYDVFEGVIREKPGDQECKEIYGRVIRELSVVGSEAALHMLTTMIAYILWAEGTPPRGPAFEEVMAALRYGLRNQIESLDSASQKAGGKVH